MVVVVHSKAAHNLTLCIQNLKTEQRLIVALGFGSFGYKLRSN